MNGNKTVMCRDMDRPRDYPYGVCLVAQSYLTLCDPMDYGPQGFSALEILQARILEWVAIPFSRASSPPRDRILIFTEGGFLTA